MSPIHSLSPAAPTACYATKTNLAFAIALATTYILRSSLAVAAEPGPAAAPAYNVEVKPLTTLTYGLLGGFGLDLAGEAMLDDHLALVASLSGSSYHLSNSMVKAITDRKGSDYSLVQSGRSEGAGLGVRWYAAPADSTWYVGATAAGGASTDHWVRGRQQLDAETTAYGLNLGGGYRWLFDSGLSLRLGGGVALGSTFSRVLTVADADGQDSTDLMNAAKKRYATTTAARPFVDFGIGWTF